MAEVEYRVTDPLEDGTALVQSHAVHTQFPVFKSCFAAK